MTSTAELMVSLPGREAADGPAKPVEEAREPWFGSIAIACGALATGALLALGVWADAGLGELTGGLRLRTIQAEQVGRPAARAQPGREGARLPGSSGPPERLRQLPI